MTRPSRATLIPLAPLLMGACGIGDPGTDVEAVADFADTVIITTSTLLDLDGVNGSIEVFGDAPAGLLFVEGVRRVRSGDEQDARERLADIKVTIQELGATLNITTEHLEDPNGRVYEVDYRVSVPPTFDVDIRQVNGGIAVSEHDAEVTVRSVNGGVTLTDVTGDLNIDVTNGAIDADVVVRSGGEVDMRTVNGDLGLTIPAKTSARFEAKVVNGTIGITNLLLNDQTITSNRVSGTLGTGDGRIELSVTNGSVDAKGR